jgi:hypothetical protein
MFMGSKHVCKSENINVFSIKETKKNKNNEKKSLSPSWDWLLLFNVYNA